MEGGVYRMQKKTYTNCSSHKMDQSQGACSLCGQLYHNFAFKGGYICEDCLDSIKDQEASPQVKQKDA